MCVTCRLLKLKVSPQHGVSSGDVTIIRMLLWSGKPGVAILSALQGAAWMYWKFLLIAGELCWVIVIIIAPGWTTQVMVFSLSKHWFRIVQADDSGRIKGWHLPLHWEFSGGFLVDVSDRWHELNIGARKLLPWREICHCIVLES